MIAILAIGANSNSVSADPCTAQLNYPIMPAAYSYSNIPISVPMSAVCSTSYGSQLYATGNAYDATTNAGLGSVSTVLQSADGTTFNGQLNFNLPSSTQGHTVQLSASIYNGQYGNQITATSETIQVGNGNQLQYQQVTTTTVVTSADPPNQYPYPYPAPSNQPYPSQTPANLYGNQNNSFYPQYQAYRYRSSLIFAYVAIVAILVAVFIATAGLVVYGRRQPTPVTWIPAPPPR